MPTAAQLTGKGFLVQWLYGVQTLLQIIMVCDTRNQLLNLGSQTPTRCVSQVKMMKTLWGDHICSLDLAGPWWNGCTFVRQHGSMLHMQHHQSSSSPTNSRFVNHSIQLQHDSFCFGSIWLPDTLMRCFLCLSEPCRARYVQTLTACCKHEPISRQVLLLACVAHILTVKKVQKKVGGRLLV